jgi:hypothetical protein
MQVVMQVLVRNKRAAGTQNVQLAQVHSKHDEHGWQRAWVCSTMSCTVPSRTASEPGTLARWPPHTTLPACQTGCWPARRPG